MAKPARGVHQTFSSKHPILKLLNGFSFPANVSLLCNLMEEYFMLKYKSKHRLWKLGGPCGVASVGWVIYRGG